MASSKRDRAVGGGKTIDFRNSMFLMTNNIMGVGMLALPVLYQQAGWLPTTLGVLFFMVLSSFSATMLCEAMALIPGNRDFGSRVEFTTAVRWYFGRRWYLATQLFFNFSLVLNNIASIVVVAQCLDNFFALIFRSSVALELLPATRLLEAAQPGVDPFGPRADLLLSAGYLFVVLFVLPLGFLNLDDNVHCQRVTMYVSSFVLCIFVAYFCQRPDKHLDSAPIGDNLVQLLSVCIFSFCFVTAVPSWANEKRPDVPVNRVVWSSTAISTVVYIALGVLGAWSMPQLRSDNIMNDMAHARAPLVVHIGIFAYTFTSVVPSIPLMSILVRYNLELDLFPRQLAAFVGCVLPYLLGWLFYKGEGFAHLILWPSLLITGTINYVAPLALYLRALTSLPDPTPAHFLSLGAGAGEPGNSWGAALASPVGGVDSPSAGDADRVEEEVWRSYVQEGQAAPTLFDAAPAGGVDPALAEWRREAEGRHGALASHRAFLPVQAVPQLESRWLRWLTPTRVATILLVTYAVLLLAQTSVAVFYLVFLGRDMLQ